MALDLTDPAALAASLDPPTRALIGGRSVESASGRTFATLNPATGAELAQVAECDATDVDRAVVAARTAFEDGPWGRMAPSDRKRLILRFASLVEAHTGLIRHSDQPVSLVVPLAEHETVAVDSVDGEGG